MKNKNIYFYESPLGRIVIATNGKAITHLYFDKDGAILETISRVTALLKEAAVQLEQYFAGRRQSFALPLAPEGTAFQLNVWRELQKIPYGETRSYGQIALAAGSGKAARAVGGANNKNPIAIIIPCHRVIGSDGKLVGYGGGLDKKASLLTLEKRYAGTQG